MTAPFDPDETRGGSGDDVFGEDSGTWGVDDPVFDMMLRERIGQTPVLPTPPYAFERVLVAGRRHRARKVWAVGAAVLVVLAGTAGTTAALRGATVGGGSPLPPAVAVSQAATPTPSAPASTPGSAPTRPSVPQCQSADLQLTASAELGGSDLADLNLGLRNISAHTCTVDGFPGLTTEAEDRQPQTTRVTEDDNEPPQELTVAPGHVVSAVDEYEYALPASAASGVACGAPAYYLVLTLPNERTPLVASIENGPMTVCGSHGIDDTPFFASPSD